MHRRDGYPEMDTRGSPERFPGLTDRPLRREGDTVLDAQVRHIFSLVPSPEEQRELCDVLQRLHPAEARTIVTKLLCPVLLCGAVSADSPKFGCILLIVSKKQVMTTIIRTVLTMTTI